MPQKSLMCPNASSSDCQAEVNRFTIGVGALYEVFFDANHTKVIREQGQNCFQLLEDVDT